MSAESPAEYVERLREDNKGLRAALLQVVREKNVILEQMAQLCADYQRLRRETGRAPHDYEPARPGLSDVD